MCRCVQKMREVMFETMKESSMEEAVMDFEFNDQFFLFQVDNITNPTPDLQTTQRWATKLEVQKQIASHPCLSCLNDHFAAGIHGLSMSFLAFYMPETHFGCQFTGQSGHGKSKVIFPIKSTWNRQKSQWSSHGKSRTVPSDPVV